MLIRVRLPPLVRFRKFLSEYTAEYMHIKSFEFFYIYICLELCKPGQQTFCNFPQLRLSNGLFTELLANVVFFCSFCGQGFVQMWLQTEFREFLPPSFTPSLCFFFFHPNHNSLFKASDQLASVPFSGLRLVNGHLDKSFPESIM